MSRTLSKSLGTDLAALAQVLRSKGRGRDTVLAHITPQEAALLKRRGGRGSINPNTGLPEFEDGDISFDFGESGASASDWTPPAAVDTAPVDPTPVSTPDPTPAANPTPAADPTPATSAGAATDPNAYASPGEGMPPDVNQTAQTAADATPSTPWYQAGLDKATSYLTDPANLAKLGLLGAGALFGAKQGQTAANQSQAAQQQIAALAPAVQDRSVQAQQQLQQIAQNARTTGTQAAQDLSALGAPARDLGTSMMTGAVSGNLTPANQASLAALKARAEQDISNRGGVGAMQAGVAEESAQAQLAQQQLQQGLATYQQGAAYSQQAIALQQAQDNMAAGIQQQAVSTALQQAGIADQYTINAIMTGLQMDQATAQSLKSFYTSLAQVGFSQSGTAQTKYNPNTGALN